MSLPLFQIESNKILNYRDILKMTKLPKKMAIIGGGVIGLEMATYLNRLGVELTVFELAPQILGSAVDHDVASLAKKSFEKKGIKILNEVQVTKVQDLGKQIELSFQIQNKNHKDEFDQILVSIGRKPQIDVQNKLKLKLDSRNYILTNAHYQTNLPHIYAIGDVRSGGPLLAHRASKEGLLCSISSNAFCYFY